MENVVVAESKLLNSGVQYFKTGAVMFDLIPDFVWNSSWLCSLAVDHAIRQLGRSRLR